MKTLVLSAFLALALAAAAGALEPAPPTVESLDREIQEISSRLRDATEQISALRKSLDAVEKRLGESYRNVSPFDTVERRLEELEKDVNKLNRR